MASARRFRSTPAPITTHATSPDANGLPPGVTAQVRPSEEKEGYLMGELVVSEAPATGMSGAGRSRNWKK